MRIGLAGTGRIGAFHASTLLSLPEVDELVVTDVRPEAAQQVARDHGDRVRVVQDVAAVLAEGVDGFAIATATDTHTQVLRQALESGVPTFCEKPVATTVSETVALVRLADSTGVPVHVGFQRRFDDGYVALRALISSGELGFVHTIRSTTLDQHPPHADYIPGSGGIFRDCNVHDYDAVRFVTGQEVLTVSAAGGNQGEAFFGEAGDVDTAASLLTLESGALALVSATRYNGAGHDVRMEVMGQRGSWCAGLDDSLAMRSTDEGLAFPAGPVHHTFMDRFQPAYVAELTAFAEMARGERPSPCTLRDALQSFRVAEACHRARREQRVVTMSEVEGG